MVCLYRVLELLEEDIEASERYAICSLVLNHNSYFPQGSIKEISNQIGVSSSLFYSSIKVMIRLGWLEKKVTGRVGRGSKLLYRYSEKFNSLIAECFAHGVREAERYQSVFTHQSNAQSDKWECLNLPTRLLMILLIAHADDYGRVTHMAHKELQPMLGSRFSKERYRSQLKKLHKVGAIEGTVSGGSDSKLFGKLKSIHFLSLDWMHPFSLRKLTLSASSESINVLNAQAPLVGSVYICSKFQSLEAKAFDRQALELLAWFGAKKKSWVSNALSLISPVTLPHVLYKVDKFSRQLLYLSYDELLEESQVMFERLFYSDFLFSQVMSVGLIRRLRESFSEGEAKKFRVEIDEHIREIWLEGGSESFLINELEKRPEERQLEECWESLIYSYASLLHMVTILAVKKAILYSKAIQANGVDDIRGLDFVVSAPSIANGTVQILLGNNEKSGVVEMKGSSDSEVRKTHEILQSFSLSLVNYDFDRFQKVERMKCKK